MDTGATEIGPELGKRNGAPTRDLDLLAALNRLQDSFDAKIRYDEVRERQIAVLHAELETHRRGLYQQILRPVLTDLIGVYDEAARVASGGAASLLESIQEVLLRNGVMSFTCEGDRVDRSRQQVIEIVPTSQADQDRRVARRLRPGFELAGKILRPEWIAAYRYARDGGAPADGSPPDTRDSNRLGAAD